MAEDVRGGRPGGPCRRWLGARGGHGDWCGARRGHGDAAREVVGGEASVGHHLGDVLWKLLGGDGDGVDDDEAGLAGVADDDDAHAGPGRQVRRCGRRHGRR